MLDLTNGARPDERFHLEDGPPVIRRAFDWGWLRRTQWACGPDWFVSWWVVGHLQWYHGTAKCDGTRTRMAWNGQLGDPVAETVYVMTTTPTELSAFRWRSQGPGELNWDNMGGS